MSVPGAGAGAAGAARGRGADGPTAETAPYGVRLDGVNFEGPLDLLLFLIKRNEIDVADIPIALVAEQFLGYLERISAESLEAAGDFLLMAATLLRIKARMLLPQPEPEEEGEAEDPREELVARLLEYQRYKEVAGRLRDWEAEARRLHPRGAGPPPELEPPPEALEPPERRVSLRDLLRAFAAVLAARPAETVHHVDVVRVTLEERVHHVRGILAARESVLFGELFPQGASRVELVVTFLALLEMVRNGEVRLRQEASFGEIRVAARGGAPGPVLRADEDAWPPS